MGIEKMNIFVNKIIDKFDLQSDLILKKAIRGYSGITIRSLLEALISTNNITEASTYLGYTSNGPVRDCISKVLYPLFPERERDFFSNGKASWRYELLLTIGYKKCYHCSEIKPLYNFGNNAGKIARSDCKNCHTYKSKLRKQDIVLKTPKWADLEKIRLMYTNCPENMEVDHIIPLNGKLVSGLHVHYNLQYLSNKDNLEKSNKFEI